MLAPLNIWIHSTYKLVWQKVWLCETIFDYSVLDDVSLSVLSLFIYSAEKSKFNSIVEHQYKFAHNWKCFYRDEEIFTLAPKPRIQTASRAVKTNHLMHDLACLIKMIRSSESGGSNIVPPYSNTFRHISWNNI